jgi:cytochrome P450
MTTPAAPGCPVDESFDPLAPDFLADPYAVMAALSNQGAPLFFAPSIGYYIVTRYRDIEAVFHDPGKALGVARAARRASARTGFDRARMADAAEKIEKAAFARADLIEIVGAQLPVDTERTPHELVEGAVDDIGLRLTAPR